jgi:hypothetical protein
LPERYGSWKTVSSRYYRWQRAGVWDRILAALQRHTHPEGADRVWPNRSLQRLLARHRCGEPRRCRGEGSLYGITDDLEGDAALDGDGVFQEDEMLIDRSVHRGAVALPERGAPFDVGEQERHRPARQIRHRGLLPAS